MPTLFTIGYEQAPLADVIDTLKRAKVKILIDTRAVAASRRAGFSKKALSAALDEAGIAYLHFQKLGTPPSGREAARAGDYNTLWKVYGRHIKTRAAQEELAEVNRLVTAGRKACLLCYERKPEECHRSKIAELVAKQTGAKIVDLFPGSFI